MMNDPTRDQEALIIRAGPKTWSEPRRRQTAYFAVGSAPNQPGRLFASVLFARSKAFTKAVPKSFSTSCFFDAATQEIRPQKLKEWGAALGAAAGADQLPDEASEGIIDAFG